MEVFVAAFLVFSLAFVGLALGWLLNEKVLKGSCGGLSTIPGIESGDCSCSTPCEKRRKRELAAQQAAGMREDVIEFKGRS